MSIDGMHIPDSWKWTSAEVACGSVRDGTHDTPQYLETGIPLVTSKNLVNGDICFNKTKLISLEEHTEISKRSGVENGDILYAMIGTIGNPVVVNTAKLFSIKNVALFKKNVDYIRPKYLKYWLESSDFDKWLKPRLRGTTQKFAPLGLLRSLPIPLAPLNQQKRIVAEIEKQFSRLDEAVANLKRVKANLKRYKAAVLKAAVEGKLTEEWRKQHPDVEPADKLLERILAERREKWQGRGKYKEPVAPDTTDLPELPERWIWASPEQVASGDQYSLTIGPFGSNLKVSDYKEAGVPLVFVRNIRSNSFGGLKSVFVSHGKAKELKAHQVSGGDLLITKMGDPPGDVCIYPKNHPRAVITADCIKLQLSLSFDTTSYILRAVESRVVQNQILGITKGVAQLKVSLARFKTISLPIPPISEQRQISVEVERYFSIIVKIEAQVDSNLHRAEKLRQSILKKAFSGKLIFNAGTATPQVTPQVRKSKAEK